MSLPRIPPPPGTMPPIPEPPRPRYTNELYLTVLPLIHMTQNQVLGFGLTEETITLFPNKEFATRFFRDEVNSYIETFKWRADKYLTGGHVLGYDVEVVEAGDGRVIVKVTQNVA